MSNINFVFAQANTKGQLGLSSGTPVSLGSLPGEMAQVSFISFSASINALTVAEISASSNPTCILFTTGGVFCWGGNTHGGTGLDDTAEPVGDDPGDMENLKPLVFAATITHAVVQVSAGDASVCGNCYLAIEIH